MTHATRLALTLVAFCVAVIAALTAGFFLVQYQIDKSQSQWCDTLRLLTAHAVPRPKNSAADPSRYENYLLYQDFLNMRHRFGC